MTLPGCYYQEISAHRFMHFSSAYVAPLSADQSWQLRLAVTSAYLDYEVWRVILRYGHGFNALRDGHDGAHSVGLLHQYDFE